MSKGNRERDHCKKEPNPKPQKTKNKDISKITKMPYLTPSLNGKHPHEIQT